MVANYPFFYPILSHDIDLDIPSKYQFLIKSNYRVWQYGICLGVVLDFIASIIIGSQMKYYMFLVTKLFYALLIPPLTFMFVYFPIYKYVKQSSSVYRIGGLVGSAGFIVYLGLGFIGCLGFTNTLFFPGGDTGIYFIFLISYSTLAVLTAIFMRVWWSLILAFYLYELKNLYYMDLVDIPASGIGNQKSPSKQNDPVKSNNIALGNVSLNGTKVAQVSVDPKTVVSLGSTAVKSGAANQVIAGSSIEHKNGKFGVRVDPRAAANAAVTMHQSGNNIVIKVQLKRLSLEQQ